MEKKYVTIKQAAKILGVSALTLRNWDNNGKFPAGRHPISNYRVYKVSDLEDIIMEIDESKGRSRSRHEVKKLMVKHLGQDQE